jgi:hypothetical protein
MATINISTGESKWAAYKRWEIDQIAAAAKAKLRKNDPLYDYRHSLVPKRPIECPE